MTLTRHAVPQHLLERIARGEGSAALEFLVHAQRSKVILLIRMLVDLTTATGHPQAGPTGTAYRALRTVADRSPAAVHRVLTHPSVANWSLHTVAALDTGADADPSRLTLIAAAAAVRGHVRWSFEIESAVRHPAGLPLPTLGFLRCPGAGARMSLETDPGGAAVVIDNRRVALEVGGHPHWQPLDRIAMATGAGKWTMTVDDPHNPWPLPHPRLTTDALEQWRRALPAGWRQLDGHGSSASDVRAAITTLAPLPAPDSGHVSGTYRHAFGCVGMSLPADDRSTAVTLVHELQHMKLSAVMDLFDLVDNASTERWYAPWRDDPRPPAGLLHGAYAHLGVAGFWRRQATLEKESGPRELAQIEYLRWRDGAAQVARQLLGSSALTPIGLRFTGTVLDQLTAWQKDSLPRTVTTAARRLADDHRDRYESSGPTSAEGCSYP